jgi:hypothetical protein
MSALLHRKPVLWFLFLFNAAIAIAIAAGGSSLHLHGSQQLITAAGWASSPSAPAPASSYTARSRPDRPGRTTTPASSPGHKDSEPPPRAGGGFAVSWRPAGAARRPVTSGQRKRPTTVGRTERETSPRIAPLAHPNR